LADDQDVYLDRGYLVLCIVLPGMEHCYLL
jgi:hypothetical protein